MTRSAVEVDVGHSPNHEPFPATIRTVKEAPVRQTLRRRSDEPSLEIGSTVQIKEGVVGVVLARFIPSGEKGRNEVHYIVELIAAETEKRKP